MSEEKQEERKVNPVLNQQFMDFMTAQVAARKEEGEDTGNAIEVKVLLVIEEDGSLSIFRQEISSGVIVGSPGDDEE